MAKKDDIGSMIDALIAQTATGSSAAELVDIITFCEDPKFLDLQKQGISLWPMQKITLKIFYRGSEGNKHVQLTEQEVELIKEIAKHEEFDYDERLGFQQILGKFDRNRIFTHLLLVMGRRSSKTLMVSIIAAYESYKLLQKPDGDPHKYYNLPADKPIAILNVAASEKQAYDPLFLEIQTRLFRAPYFQDKINYPAVKKGEIFLLTEADKRENARRATEGITVMLDGSIVLKSGHSNSRTLRGQAAIAVLFDEYAHFMTSTGVNSGDEAYNALTPSVQQFGENGKIVLLSDPKGRDGMFWKLFKMAEETEEDPSQKDIKVEDMKFKYDEILAIQVPTWRMNPNKNVSFETLAPKKKADPVAFESSWGARFMGEQGSLFFDERRITDCIDFALIEAKIGDPKYVYHIHLDPATSSHNYALVMSHAVTYMDKLQQIRRKIFVDVVKYWKPDKTGPVNIDEVEKCIIDLCRRFRVATVTFDQWQSAQTIQRLKARGINAYETKFINSYLTEIYGQLRTLVNQGEIALYPHDELIGEMKCLLYKILRSGFKRGFDPKSLYPSDDLCDALAGSAYMALQKQVCLSLPRPAVVYFPRS